MPTARPVILGFETSCDETAAAVVAGGRDVRSSIIATQHDLHSMYAGVVPEIASRAHLERLVPVVREAMRCANATFNDLDAIAVGHRPGLIGSLLVGVSAAKALAWSIEKPIIGVDHVIAHLFACELADDPIEYPAIGLVASGGHTSLYLVRDELDVQRIGRTIDDAVGEAFDKGASILGLGYPGGPQIDRIARQGNDAAFDFPIASLAPGSLDFSFSGLKTSLLYAVREHLGDRSSAAAASSMNSPTEEMKVALSEPAQADFAASFQRAAVTALIRKIRRALQKNAGIRSLIVGGGVSANTRLRAELAELAGRHGLLLRLPRMEYCLDNAAMIAGHAAARLRAGLVDNWSLAAAVTAS
jgi:N6-L-threonylcarbamoyladenine synthase